MQHSIREVGNFGSGTELEAAYYDTIFLEVRAGIIHSLITGARHSVDRFPLDWRTNFFMKVCKECLAEAGELSVLNNATPYPHHRASHDETMHVIGQKNEWMNKSTQFSKIANKCLLALMARYVDSRINLYGGELEEDKIAEEILDLMSNPATARQIGVEPKKFEKFFETYKKQHIKLSAPDMISKWYQAVIRFGFLNILYDCPPNVVQQEIAEYLKQEIGTLYSGKLILSDLAKTTMPVSVQRAVEYLVKLLLKTGKLDSLDVEN